jgi:hypothetical protein
MLDANALQQLIEQQVQIEVTDRVTQMLTQEWVDSVEENAIKFIQARVVAKFANSEYMPELVNTVKSSVKELFGSGQLPGLGQYVDHDSIKQSIDTSTQSLIESATQELSIDPKWLAKIEQQINLIMVQRVVAKLGSIDIGSLVNQRVDTIADPIFKRLLPGIQDQSNQVELTVLDKNVVVENTLTAKSIEAVDSVIVKDLVVKGSINTDNQSWKTLASSISQQTLEKLSEQWKQTLVEQVSAEIAKNGIEFDSVKVNGEHIVFDHSLNSSITESNLRKVGTLRELTVAGETTLNETVSVVKKRVGINTSEPEMALSVWDEEVSVIAGKFKANTAYIGTSRKQSLTIGINKKPAVEINDDGLTAIKQLQVGLHRISHGNEVPNYSGNKGDIVFNANPGLNSDVFAWQCLGGFKWKVIKSVS